MRKKLTPLNSLLATICNMLKGKISFPKSYDNTDLVMPDKQKFKIFRHVIIGKKEEIKKDCAVFVVRFKLKKMSVEKNKRFSRIPIPMFIGLPGFKAKFWMCDEETGYNQGIYQWETKEDAENYSKSFAVDFMSKRSIKGSITWEIIENKNIFDYVEGLLVK